MRRSCFSNLSHYPHVALFNFLLFPVLTPIPTNSTTATTTLRSRRASRLTNDGAGAGVPTTVPGDIPTQFAPVGPEAPKATRAPRAPAGHCRTDGRAAWGGYGPTAATAPGASAGWSTTSNFSPRSLISTTTPPLPVPSTSGSSEQINVAYHPHHYQGGFLSIILRNGRGSLSRPLLLRSLRSLFTTAK